VVMVCSDYRELSYHKPIMEQQKFPDLIFVCSSNHAIGLYESMAIADADRYFTHVIVCNNFNHGEECSAKGTIVASPMTDPSKYIRKPCEDEIVNVEVPSFAGQVISLWIPEINIQALEHRDRESQVPGFRRSPICRR
jgi:hypothetical protein